MDYIDWFDLRMKVTNVAPELDPPPAHWLESDCSPNYCREHVIVERGKEFDFGPPIRDSDYFHRTDLEAAFFNGISSDPHRCPGHSDNAAACYTCGTTLAYWLTDYGIKSEIDYWQDATFGGDLSEIAYSLDRLFECDEHDKPKVEAIALRFLEYVKANS